MKILLLGAPLILMDQSSLESLRRKNRALIFYLAAHAAPVTRDQILSLFWPDTPRSMAQQTLRTMLHDLRKHLENRYLVLEDDRLTLDQQVEVDVREFEAGLTSPTPEISSLVSTLKLYRGAYLDGFTLPDTPSFDDWMVIEREHYLALAIKGYATLSRLYEAERDHAAALGALSQALAFDPLQEDLQREALRLHYLSGDRAAAIRRYEVLCKLLSEEMGLPPMPETRAVYDAIISDTLPISPIQPSRQAQPASVSLRQLPAEPLMSFTGRAVELNMLQTLSQSGKLLLVEGAPGMGKTRLVNEFFTALKKSSRSAGRAVLVLRSVAHELEQGLPYQPIVDALRSLLFYDEWPAARANLNLAPVWLAEICGSSPIYRGRYPTCRYPQAQPMKPAFGKASINS